MTFVNRYSQTRHGHTPYQSILLVQGKRVPAKRPAGRPAANAAPRKSVVIHQTLANLSKLPEELIGLIESYCKQGEVPAASSARGPQAGSAAVHVGPCYGLLAALHALVTVMGLVSAVGRQTRVERLALYLVYARLCHQGSRLSAAQFSEDQAVREVMGVGRFDEDALRWLISKVKKSVLESPLRNRS